MRTLLKLAGALALLIPPGSQAVIVAPEPPPELGSRLSDYRTRQQTQERELLRLSEQDSREAQTPELKTEPVPAGLAAPLPGDVSAGVLRRSFIYSEDLILGVPALGRTVLRFYDLAGVPWKIGSARSESGTFQAGMSASAEELVIEQEAGAVRGRLKVVLENYPRPLVFRLKPVNFRQEGILVTTSINSVRIDSLFHNGDYVFPEKIPVPEPNPLEKPLKFSQDAGTLARHLVRAVYRLFHEN